ncbi:MAG TPA: ArsR family transcriptional regulator [Candidatus Thermoplasmatota archaeon]|nr:ArsR family transcriptional regulator [Candidatus Thermoplasmatota archaeon]
MAETFAIYATPKGYVAVTNPVRQRILRTLEDGEATLTDLVKLTGKAKSTLSAVHLRDLLDHGLVDERAHDDDARVKLYALAARRIGSSSVPLEDLRDAVRSYVASPQGGLALPLANIVDAFDQLPKLRPDEARWIGLVGERLGTLAAAHLKEQEPTALLRELAEVWRRDGLGKAVRPRDATAIELTHAEGARPGGPRCALIRGFLQGALTTRSGRAAWVEERRCAGKQGRACLFAVGWPARAR